MKSIVRIGIFFSSLFVFAFLFSCVSARNKRTEIIDNTFRIDISNGSRFEVEIDSQKIMPGKIIQHNLPLHESVLYDGWSVTYKIPISETESYLHSEKITIADSQNALEIKNPSGVLETETYIKIKNNSHASIQITSTGNNYLPIFFKGQINGVSYSNDYYIPNGKIGIVKARNVSSLSIKNDKGIQSIFKDGDIQASFVYTYEYDGKNACLVDSRPLLTMGEETWEATFAENVSVCKMLRRPDSDALYFAGTETALDAKGFPFLRGVAGRIEISNSGAESALEEFRFAPFDVDGDAQFFDAMLLDSGELVAVGQISAEEPHGIIARYTEEGAASDFALSEETIALGALCGSTDGSSFFAGGIDSDGNIVVMSVSCGTSFVRRKIAALPIIASETADGIRFCYSATEDFILLAVNIKDADGFPLSRLYKISSNGGAMDEINLKGKISEVSSIVLNQNNTAILTGETFSGTKATACILTVQLDEQSCETQFISPNAPSWISDACFSESSDELILCGMTVFGKNRVPFMRAFNAHDFQPTWEQTYSAPTFKGLNDAAFFVPCADYGFLVGISALDADNNRRAPFKIVRVTSTGKISKNHQIIQLKGAEK